jgi:pimeloyl-ACP methyl ester carboxylesterase
MRVETRSIVTKAAEIRLSESAGTGLPLLLIHGAGASREVFRKQFDSSLATRFRLIAPDLPGHGESSDAADPAHDYSVPGLSTTLCDIIAALALDRFAIFGWSLGGHIGIELLARHPGVAGLMITGAPPVGRGPIALLRGFQANWDMLLASKPHFSERDAQRFYELCYHGAGDPAFLAAIRRADGRARPAVSLGMLRGEGADQRQTFERALVPTAVVNGAEETIARLSYFRSLDDASLWGRTCHVIANAGHAPFWDQPVIFNDLLGRFVDDVVASDSTEPARRTTTALSEIGHAA